VVNYLVSKGIESQRLIARGYGESQPIADNETEEGRAANRRVEMKIVK
jgi:outer membrane protein OmpA-like peptidoglycan-associated protein